MSLSGLFLFSYLIFRGAEFPKPNPDLNMWFEFESKGINTLHYTRANEKGFCERKANYEYDGKTLKQKIIWVHPENASWCSNDPDMQLGQETTSKMQVKDNKLFLDLNLAEDVLTLVWIQNSNF